MGQSTPGGQTHEVDDQADGRLRALLSSMRDIVLVRDADGILTYCSPSVFDALGYGRAELEGTRERELIHAGDVAAGDDLVWGSRSDDPPPPIDLRMRDRQGLWHWFEAVEANPLDDPEANGIVTYAPAATARTAERPELLQRS